MLWVILSSSSREEEERIPGIAGEFVALSRLITAFIQNSVKVDLSRDCLLQQFVSRTCVQKQSAYQQDDAQPKPTSDVHN